jgi:hypothetical protein
MTLEEIKEQVKPFFGKYKTTKIEKRQIDTTTNNETVTTYEDVQVSAVDYDHMLQDYELRLQTSLEMGEDIMGTRTLEQLEEDIEYIKSRC